MPERHRATIGVFGIPQDDQGRGLWSKRADGKGINAIGGAVDLEDSQNKKSLIKVLEREFLEEAGVKLAGYDGRPLGVFPLSNLGDIAILYYVGIEGDPKPSEEAEEHIWMSPKDILDAAIRYDSGDHANGLLSGKDKRQWQMAKAFFAFSSSNKDFRSMALQM